MLNQRHLFENFGVLFDTIRAAFSFHSKAIDNLCTLKVMLSSELT